jgi:hypothetical protein
MPLRASRAFRPPVVADPVVRTAADAGTAKAVSDGIDKRQDSREDLRDDTELPD